MWSQCQHNWSIHRTEYNHKIHTSENQNNTQSAKKCNVAQFKTKMSTKCYSSASFSFNWGWISGRFFLINRSCSAFSQLKRFLFSSSTFAAAENKRLLSTLVQGADMRASAAKPGNRDLLFLQYSKVVVVFRGSVTSVR